MEKLKDVRYQNTVIPAAPGFSLAIFVEAGAGPPCIDFDPIVAWNVELMIGTRSGEHECHSCLTPITVDGDPPANLWAIKRPDGKIQETQGPTFDSTEQFLAHCVTQRDQANAKKVGAK